MTWPAIKWMATNILLSQILCLSICFTLIMLDNHAVGSQLEVVKLQWINVFQLSHQIPLLLSPMPHKRIVLMESPLKQFLVQGDGKWIRCSVHCFTLLSGISMFPFATFVKAFNELMEIRRQVLFCSLCSPHDSITTFPHVICQSTVPIVQCFD